MGNSLPFPGNSPGIAHSPFPSEAGEGEGNSPFPGNFHTGFMYFKILLVNVWMYCLYGM